MQDRFHVCFLRTTLRWRWGLPLFDGPYITRVHVDEVDVSSTVGELKLCAAKIIIPTQNNGLAYYRTDGPLVY
jgi:hypothetical protein